MPKVSVIVPIFGVEKYIERCAQSLFAQTIDDNDVEFIFVNDCTEDASMEVLGHVVAEHPEKNVTILNHKANLGLPTARRTGLKAAKGDFVIHCDSDDWVEPDYCKKLYETAITKKADIVVCGYWLNDGKTEHDDDSYDDNLLTNPRCAASAAISLKSSPYVWNKLVRRSLYEAASVLFPKRFLAEDWALTVQLVMATEKIVFIEDKLYNYFINPASILRTPTKEMCLKKITDEEENVRLVDNLLKSQNLGKQFRAEITKRKALTKSFVFPCTADDECRRAWRRTFPEADWAILFSPYVDRQYKKKHISLMFGLYAPLRRLYHVLRGLKAEI